MVYALNMLRYKFYQGQYVTPNYEWEGMYGNVGKIIGRSHGKKCCYYKVRFKNPRNGAVYQSTYFECELDLVK